MLLHRFPEKRHFSFSVACLDHEAFAHLAIDLREHLYGDGVQPALIAVTGILLGAASILALDQTIPHRHFVSGIESPSSETLKKIWLFVMAITIHNIPEGLAVGIVYGRGNFTGGTELAIGIGLQNAPEGLAVALALQSEGCSKCYAVCMASLTGLVKPIAGTIGAGAVGISELVLPWGLVFAAVVMFYVNSHEIIPETHRRGCQDAATIGLMIGLVLMLFLDVSLG